MVEKCIYIPRLVGMILVFVIYMTLAVSVLQIYIFHCIFNLYHSYQFCKIVELFFGIDRGSFVHCSNLLCVLDLIVYNM